MGDASTSEMVANLGAKPAKTVQKDVENKEKVSRRRVQAVFVSGKLRTASDNFN